MSSNENDRPSAEDELNLALANLIKNTRTTRRHLSLPEIAHWLGLATASLGSMDKVADRIGLSTKMLRQFLAVNDLALSVRGLFATRQLDSVDVAVHLRMLNLDEQVVVASAAARGDFSTAEIRAICQYRKKQVGAQLEEIMEQVKASRDIKVYVVEFVQRGREGGGRQLRRRLASVLGDDNIVSLKFTGSIGTLVLNKGGRARLLEFCRSRGITKPDAVDKIVNGESSE
jgi:hypothetical protein